MLRNRMLKYYPHVLLLAFATAAFTAITSLRDGSQDGTARTIVVSHEAAQASSVDDAEYQYAYAKSRGLADVLAGARHNLKRLRHETDSDDVEQADPRPSDPAAQAGDTPHHRVVRRMDIDWVTPAPNWTGTPYVENGSSADPMAWQLPDALPQREYDILAFGEIDRSEPELTVRDNNKHTDSEQTTPVPATHTDARMIGAAVVDADVVSASAISPTRPAAVSDRAVQAASDAPASATIAPVEPVTRAVSASQVSRMGTPSAAIEPHAASRRADAQAALMTAQTAVKLSHAEENAQPSQPYVEQPRNEASPSKTQAASELTHAEMIVSTQDKPVISLPVAVASSNSAKTKDTPTVALPAQASPSARAHSNSRGRDQTQSLVVLVDDRDAFGSDKLNAINNALKQINQAAKQADIDLELSITTDSKASHNVLLREADNTTLNGKLGLAQSAAITDDNGHEVRLGQDAAHLGGQAVASLNRDVNWYTGDDDGGIGRNQYDYQTAVTHELLHLLGLDDDFGSNLGQVMHGYLSMGEARRVIEATETRELASLYANNNLWKSASYTDGNSIRNNRNGIRYRSEALTAAPLPEPASLVIIGMGMFAIGLRQLR